MHPLTTREGRRKKKKKLFFFSIKKIKKNEKDMSERRKQDLLHLLHPQARRIRV